MRNLNDIFVLDGANPNSWHLDVAVEGLLDGDSVSVYDHLISLLFEEFSIISNDTKTPIYLFRFTGLPVLQKGKVDETKPVINDIVNEALTFAKPKVFNDPMDPILREWMGLKKKEAVTKLDKRFFKYLKNSLENLRICCLSRNEGNRHRSVQFDPLMWAHYADKHKGICIEYEITDDMLNAYNNDNQVLRICNVRYRGRKTMSDYITLDNALLAKGSSWDYEHETRLLYYDETVISKTRKSGDYLSLGGFRIKSIYLGYRISEKDKSEVINAIKGKRIDLYQVHFDYADLTRLIADRVQ